MPRLLLPAAALGLMAMFGAPARAIEPPCPADAAAKAPCATVVPPCQPVEAPCQG